MISQKADYSYLTTTSSEIQKVSFFNYHFVERTQYSPSIACCLINVCPLSPYPSHVTGNVSKWVAINLGRE